jgi:WD40 repeat protein
MATANTSPRAFLSYARSDGEAFARHLRARLEADGVTLWRDREGMEGGRDWWQQICAAIDRVEYLILVITPAALGSTMVRREWRYARQRGVAVYPVCAGLIDFNALPRWMRSAHFYDLEHEWRKFVNDLHTRPTRVRVPFMVEDLPVGFVPRPREMALLVDQLLDRGREEPVALTAALRGAGGFGKTVLARALCHEEAIQNAFDDGILWVTLGERPGDLTARVEDLIFMLSGQRPGFAGIDAAVAAFAELLADRELLIVIDDVWDASHLQPFLQGGERCARIVTTRLAEVLPADARRVNVDAMAVVEAIAVLSYGLGCTADEQPDLTALARRLGEWPLLLKLVNGALRERVLTHKQPLEAALAWVNKALDKRGLTTFDTHDASARSAAVATTLGVSLAHLTQDELNRLHELAVFPEDADIPLATLAALWSSTAGLDEFDTEMLCDRLARLSLLLHFDLAQQVVRLHDVIRHFLVGRMGDGLASLHAALLGTGRPTSGFWADLPVKEPYWWLWLFEHLRSAGAHDELLSTASDLHYLAAKAVARTAFSVESDLQMAEAAEPENPKWTALRRSFAQSAHLYNGCRSVAEARATLFARLDDIPALNGWRQQAVDRWTEPHLQPLHRLPDLPHPALVRTLVSHHGAMGACAITSDGRWIATAGAERRVTLWDAHTGAELRRFVPEDERSFTGNWIHALRFSADGRVLAAAAADRRIWLWDPATGAALGQCVGHVDVVTDCALSADGLTLASSSRDGMLRVWNLPGCTPRHVLGRKWDANERGWLEPTNEQGHWTALLGCALSSDGRIAASSSDDASLIVWDLSSGLALRELKGHTQAVTHCAFAPDGRLVSVSLDGTLRVWDLETGECRGVQAHANAINACAIAEDGSCIVTASADGTLRIWTSDGDELIETLAGHTDWVYDCALSFDGSTVVSAANDDCAKVWEASRKPRRVRASQSSAVLGCAAWLQHRLLFAAASDHSVMLWDVRGYVRQRWEDFDAPVRCCAVSRDGRQLAAATADGSVVVHDTETAERMALPGHRDWVNGCAFHPNGHLLATVSNDRTLRLWDLRTRSRRLALTAHDHWINACAISPDGAYLVTAASDGTLRRWSLDFDDALWEAWITQPRPLGADTVRALAPMDLVGHEASVNACCFAPDGSWLVSASSDLTLRMWDTRTGALRTTLRGHLEDVNGCDVSADGCRIASVSSEGSVRVWDATSGRCEMAMLLDSDLVACAWVDAGHTLAVAGARGVCFLTCLPGREDSVAATQLPLSR